MGRRLAMSVTAQLLAALLLAACGSGDGGSAPAPPTAAAGSAPDFSADELQALEQAVEAGRFGEVHSVLAWRDGQMLVERYYEGHSASDRHRLYSVSKSVTAMLVGMALAAGEIPGLDTDVRTAFPEYPTLENPDLRKDAITLEDLLRMRAGFEWDEWTYPYTDARNDTTPLFESEDWVKHMLDLPMASAPGSEFTYNSGATMLLAGYIRNYTGRSAEEYAAMNLFAPLGINDWEWEAGPDGISNTGWGLFLRPRDMLKLGQLMLADGVWNGTRVLEADWVRRSSTDERSATGARDYAFQWWRLTDAAADVEGIRTNDVYYAGGWGGQLIVVVPHLDLVVVTTGGNYQGGGDMFGLVFEHILLALYD